MLVIGLAVASGWTASRPVEVLVDGEPKRLQAGSTVGDVVRQGLIAATPGDLIGVDGSVASYGGGGQALTTRNGSTAASDERLYQGDVIESRSGDDRRESIVTTDVPVPFVTRFEGSGPLTQFRTLGAPGMKRVTRGEVSGFEVTSTILSEPSDMVIVRLRPSGKLVALTFDDGPIPVETERILNVLRKHDVKATFFMLGIQVQRHPAIARRVVSDGHSVGSHTYGHTRLDVVAPAEVRKQVLRGRRQVQQATDVGSAWFRPPYGRMNAPAWRIARQLKMRTVLWDVDSRDWTRPGPKKIAAVVLRDTKPGSVVLLHDGGGDRRQTAQALDTIIPKLRDAGYTFVTLDELAEAKSAAARERSAAKRAAGPPKPVVKGGS